MDEENRRKNLIDRLNDAYGTYQNARTLMRLGQGLARAGRTIAGAARGIGALAATSEVWGPVAIAIGLVLIFTVIIVVVTGGPGAVSEIPPEEQTQQTSGILNIKGGTQQEIEEINNILSSSLSSSTYADLLTSAGPVDITLESGGCSGLVDGRSVTLYNFSSCGGTFKRYMVLHEMGHIIHARNGRLAQTFNHLEYVRLEPNCYDSENYLITYPKPEGKANAFNESFAEAIALFAIYKERPLLNDFPNQCPNTYNWVRNNIFR